MGKFYPYPSPSFTFALSFISEFHLQNLLLTSSFRVTLTSKDVEAFTEAVKNQYWFEFFLDDLPIWGWIGEVGEEDGKVYIYTTHEVTVKFNTDQVQRGTLHLPSLSPSFEY